jgi:hypothetical protein
MWYIKETRQREICIEWKIEKVIKCEKIGESRKMENIKRFDLSD